jgi:hypothetical protein
MPGPYQLTSGDPSKIRVSGPAFYGMGAGYAPAELDPLALTLNRQNLAFQEKQLEAANANAAADRALQSQLGMMPWAYKNAVFGTVSPLLNQLMGGASSGLVGGQNPAVPQVSEAPVWSPQQVDQRVNAAKAGNAQAADTATRQAQTKLAGQGFGSKSPLLAQLSGNIAQARMGGDAAADREIRWDAATGNAAHVQKSQVANQNAAVAFNDQDIKRRQSNNQYTTNLLSLLAGMV